MVLYLVALAATLGAGVLLHRFTGVYVAVAALAFGNVVQMAWLQLRAAPVVRALHEREGGITH